MKNELVVKHNEVVNASYRLSVIEQRVILCAIAKISKQVEISDNELYRVNVEDLKVLGVHNKTAYRDLREALKRLYERSIQLKIGNTVKKIRWVQEIEYTDSRGEIGIRFSKPLLPFISNLKDNFTQYLLSDVGNMKGVYSVRVYEICKQYLTLGKRKIAIDELRNMLDLGDKYKTAGHFMDKVIGLSVIEINELTDLNVKAKAIRTGRKYTHIEFKIKAKALEQTRDPNTVDMFTKMTDKQVEIFGKKLVNDESFRLTYGLIGESNPNFEFRIKTELNHPTFIKKYSKDLTRVGFKFKNLT